MAEVIIVLLLLVLLAEIFSRPRIPRSGVYVIRGEMDPDYEPPSTSLNPSAQRSAEGAPKGDNHG